MLEKTLHYNVKLKQQNTFLFSFFFCTTNQQTNNTRMYTHPTNKQTNKHEQTIFLSVLRSFLCVCLSLSLFVSLTTFCTARTKNQISNIRKNHKNLKHNEMCLHCKIKLKINIKTHPAQKSIRPKKKKIAT